MHDGMIGQVPQTSRVLAEGRGWRAREVACTAGPSDKPFEERHEGFSVAAVVAGTFTYRSQHGKAFMAPGSLLLGNAGACFECGHEHGAGDRCVAFHFSPDLFEEIAGALPSVTRLEFERHRIPPANRSVPLIAQAWRSIEQADARAIEDLAFALAAHAIALDQEVDASREQPSNARDTARITDSVRFIEAHYPDEISLDGLAAKSGLTRFHYLRLFRARVGMTPYQYALHLRLAAAARALKRRKAGVLEIALSCGFGDLSEFTRRFRRVFGVTPARYARNA